MKSVVTASRAIVTVMAALLGLILVVPIMILALPFWIVSLITHVVPSFLEPRFSSWEQLWKQMIVFDPKVGWKPKAHLDHYYLARWDDVYHIVTDSQGWPGKTSVAESEMVVFGDSFAFCYGVNISNSFAQVNPNLSIKAIGAPGYNMVQELLVMRDFLLQLRGKLVVWFICLENDLYENLMPNNDTYKIPFVRPNGTGEWELVNDHLKPTPWHHTSVRRYFDSLAQLCGPTLLSKRVYSACEFLIKEGNDVCNQAGAKLVVMTIPSAKQLSPRGLKSLASYGPDVEEFDPDFPDRKISEICNKWNIGFVASKDHLNIGDYKRFEGIHWTERGHRRIAKLLDKIYRTHMSPPPTLTARQPVSGSSIVVNPHGKEFSKAR